VQCSLETMSVMASQDFNTASMVRAALSIRASRNANLLGGRGGYFAYDSAVKRYPQIEGLGKKAINKFMRDANIEIIKTRFRF